MEGSPYRPQPPPYREPPQVTSSPSFNSPLHQVGLPLPPPTQLPHYSQQNSYNYNSSPQIQNPHYNQITLSQSHFNSPPMHFNSAPQQQHFPPQNMNQMLPIAPAPVPFLEPTTKTQYKDCVDEFSNVMKNFHDSNNRTPEVEEPPPSLPPRKKSSVSREPSLDVEKEDSNKENDPEMREKKISVKEAAAKLNKFASEEEAKIPSPMGKSIKSPEKPQTIEEDNKRDSSESLTSHPKSKEWIMSAARADYFTLSKLATEYPALVKLTDFHGYTALHWACKHGNEDIVKLIAGTYKANVNARTNGGYTALHIAMQFGKNDIFELLCNVYKADRDILDHSGKKPLEYQKHNSNAPRAYGANYKILDNIIVTNIEKVPIRQNTIKKKNHNRAFNRHTVNAGQGNKVFGSGELDDLESGNSNSLPLYKRRDQRHNQSFFKKKMSKKFGSDP